MSDHELLHPDSSDLGSNGNNPKKTAIWPGRVTQLRPERRPTHLDADEPYIQTAGE